MGMAVFERTGSVPSSGQHLGDVGEGHPPQMIGTQRQVAAPLQLSGLLEGNLHRISSVASGEALQHHPGVGNFAGDEGFGHLQASGFRKLRLSSAAMTKSALHRLQTSQTVPLPAEMGDGNSALQAGTNLLHSELRLVQDHDLIEQGQGQPIKFLLLTAYDELLAIQSGGTVGTEEIKRAHGLWGMAFPVFPG